MEMTSNVTDNQKNNVLTFSHRASIGVLAGFFSSLIAHPFQVLRARYQNKSNLNEMKMPLSKLNIYDINSLFIGYSATFFITCCLNTTLSMSKYVVDSIRMEARDSPNFISNKVYACFLGSIVCAFFITPLEAGILHQSKSIDSKTQSKNNYRIFR